MQIELKGIQQEVGITFIYVTHDQEEALTMSDRLAVFNRGRIEQVGSAGRASTSGRRRSSSPASSGRRTCSSGEVARTIVGQDGTFTVRPEKIRLAEPDDAPGADEIAARRPHPRRSSTSAPTRATSSRSTPGPSSS